MPGIDTNPKAIEPLPRDHDTPRPLVVAMILMIFAAVAAGFYWIHRLGIAENVLGQPATAAREGPLTNIHAIILEPVKRNLFGRDVVLWSVPVESVMGDYTFWVGSGAGNRVPVVMLGERASRQDESETIVRKGDQVAVFGTIRMIREVRHLDEDWAMKPDDWELLEKQQVYVSALRVDHLARPEQ